MQVWLKDMLDEGSFLGEDEEEIVIHKQHLMYYRLMITDFSFV